MTRLYITALALSLTLAGPLAAWEAPDRLDDLIDQQTSSPYDPIGPMMADWGA